MKAVNEILSFLVCCCVTAGAFGEILLADPSLVQDGRRYYLVGTENGLGETPDSKVSGQAVLPLCVSDDLYTWRLAKTPLGEGRLVAKADAFGRGGLGRRTLESYASDPRGVLAEYASSILKKQ